MKLSIEAFTGTNFMMNLLILAVSARFTGHIRWKRVFIAAAAGTLYAVAAYGLDSAWLKNACILLVILLFMAGVVFGRRRRGYLYLAGCSLFAGGILTVAERWFPSGSAALTIIGWIAVSAAAFLSDGVRSGGPEYVRLKISTRMGSVELEALVDTGNRLREPLSGLPVVIVEKRSLTGLMDKSCLIHTGRLPPGFRRVRYGVLGGNGEMRCFKPESVCIWNQNRWTEAPDVWVAIYQDTLPPHIEALAPPAMAQAAAGQSGSSCSNRE